jgi:hypothetical protein
MRLHADVTTVDTDDGLVLLHERTGRYWQLNTTGTRVLRQLLDGRSAEDIARGMADRHGIDTDTARRDVQVVLARLRAANLVEAS